VVAKSTAISAKTDCLLRTEQHLKNARKITTIVFYKTGINLL